MQARFKRFTALILSVLMVLTCMPMSAMAEDAVIPAEDISVEVIPEDAEAVPEQETATVMDTETSEPESDPVSETLPETEVPAEQVPAEETPSASETVPETETSQEEVPQEEPATQSEETQPAEATEEPMQADEIPIEEPTAETPAETEPEAEKPAPDDRHPLQAAIDTYGHIYVATVRQTDVFGNAKLDADTLVFSTTNDVFLLLATKFTDEETVKVWFMDSDGNVVSGFVSAKNLDEKYLLDEDIKDVSFLPAAQGETAIGMMSLFLVNGSYPAAETDPQIVEEPVDTPSEEEEPVSTEAEEPAETDPAETELPAETTEDEPQPETDPTEQPASEETSVDEPQETVQEEPAADPETAENPEESTETPEDLPAEPEVPLPSRINESPPPYAHATRSHSSGEIPSGEFSFTSGVGKGSSAYPSSFRHNAFSRMNCIPVCSSREITTPMLGKSTEPFRIQMIRSWIITRLIRPSPTALV